MNSHFGNPLLEQRKLLSGEAVVVREDEVVIEIRGEDSRKFLHSLTSQNILNLQDAESTESLLLSPQGHIEQQLKVIFESESCYLIINKAKATDLEAWLSKMIFRSKVSILERSDLKVIGAFRDLGLSDLVWVDPWSSGSIGGIRYAAEVHDFPYREYLIEKENELSIPKAGMLAFEALRIAAGRPEIVDIDERSLPHEFDWMNSAVHLSKGCYRGQESVAKVHNLGHPPRRLVILNLADGDVLSQSGDKVFYNEKEVGRVLLGGLHFEAGSLALALVNRNTPYLDLQVQVGGSLQLCTQQVLVPFDAGKAANLPRPSAFKLSGKK